MPYHLRKVFARFRCSSHDLMIERGRHINLDREFRYCYICYGKGKSVVETEYHFLFECEEYEGLRQDLLDVNILTNRNMYSFNKIMSSNDDRVINRVAKFIFEAFKKRSEHTF